MKFAAFPVAEAEGLILAHTLETPAGVLKKGRVLSAADLAAIRESGRAEVIGARLEAGDVAEDAAAARVAAALAGPGTRVADAVTGRANLFATASGILLVDTARLLAINRIDEGLTAATLAAFDRVEAGEMLATIKVIPFAVPEGVVAEAERLASGAEPLISVASFQSRTAGLILTQLPQTKASVLKKRERVTSERLMSAGSRLGAVETVPHDTASVAAAILRMHKAGLDPVLVFAASAIVDREDVIPAAVVEAGGQAIQVGMPVDPGNLIMVGRLGGADVIGVPSCAGSPKLNGFDWVLERRLAGLPVGREEITAMSIGGLLKEIPSRPQPRDTESG
jgi:molybdenum cofactor cytidylyltransferase